jgi:hypothetical protein
VISLMYFIHYITTNSRILHNIYSFSIEKMLTVRSMVFVNLMTYSHFFFFRSFFDGNIRFFFVLVRFLFFSHFCHSVYVTGKKATLREIMMESSIFFFLFDKLAQTVEKTGEREEEEKRKRTRRYRARQHVFYKDSTDFIIN